jgi:hypothetical protein
MKSCGKSAPASDFGIGEPVPHFRQGKREKMCGKISRLFVARSLGNVPAHTPFIVSGKNAVKIFLQPRHLISPFRFATNIAQRNGEKS